jgi:hypothetical protein
MSDKMGMGAMASDVRGRETFLSCSVGWLAVFACYNGLFSGVEDGLFACA